MEGFVSLSNDTKVSYDENTQKTNYVTKFFLPTAILVK